MGRDNPDVSSGSERNHEAHENFFNAISAAVGALLLALVGAVLAVNATTAISQSAQRLNEGVSAELMISPALVLPLLGSSLNMARDRRLGGMMISTCLGYAMLNLGLLLPVVIGVGYCASYWPALSLSPSTQPTTQAVIDLMPVPFPMNVWRLDAVALLLAGGLLMPIAAGRWTLRRVDGGILLILYIVYVLSTAKTALS
jgi:Ca2+/Na+ antiporter